MRQVRLRPNLRRHLDHILVFILDLILVVEIKTHCKTQRVFSSCHQQLFSIHTNNQRYTQIHIIFVFFDDCFFLLSR